MKHLKSFGALILACLILASCFEDNDDNAVTASEISDFVWKAMNAVYLYNAEVPDLANDRFASDQAYADYLNSFNQPEDLFESVLFQPDVVDRFSIIISDYIALENFLAGTTITNGLRFYSFAPPSNSSERILVVNYVAKNSTGDNANIVRGDFFNQIDGVTITEDNINALLSSDSYTLHYADYNDNGTPEIDDDTFTDNGTTIQVSKEVFTENPVNMAETINVDGENVGYLNYKSFRTDFLSQLDSAFGDFQASNVQHLVLDLRYNGGGSVDVARALASMITGQFTGQTFSKLVFNENLSNNNEDFDFVSDFNSLNLDKVYVLTTGQSASASELIINSLKPYITVVQIGDTTVGKTQASITTYDSPGLFNKTNINPNHTYALQPLVANSINVNDEAVSGEGIDPIITVLENPLNLGSFGDINEPLLAAAIADIQGLGRFGTIDFNAIEIESTIGIQPFEREMHLNDMGLQFKLKEN